MARLALFVLLAFVPLVASAEGLISRQAVDLIVRYEYVI